MALNILIIGAGVCGPALALILQRSNPKHCITIIERFHSLRTGGQQIDIKDQGVPIIRKMGLLEPLRQVCVHESGMELVDRKGSSLINFGITPADGSRSGPTLTNEFEFMRGDMVKLFYDTTIQDREQILKSGEKGGALKYEFNKTIVALNHSTGTDVLVTFSDNTTKHFDVVVAADGQGSRTRRLAFGDSIGTEAFKPLNVDAAYFNIPRLVREDNLARVYFGTESRMVMTRAGDRPLTQVYFFLMRDKQRAARMKAVHKQPLSSQKAVWTQHYHDAGWECQRFVDGMQSADDFYACEMGQVKMPEGKLHKGRVVLLGDAGYCPSAFTGQGTTLSLIGAYVLAGELAKHGDNVSAALEAYTSMMHTPIAQSQKLGFSPEWGFYPSSSTGIRMANSLFWTMSCLRVDKLLMWMGSFLPEEKGKWEVPEYPGLNMDAVRVP